MVNSVSEIKSVLQGRRQIRGYGKENGMIASRLSARGVLVVALFCVGVSGNASTITLPLAVGTVTASAGDCSDTLTLPPASLPLAAPCLDGENGSADAVASGGHDPAIAVSASVSPQGDFGERSGAQANLTYSFVVIQRQTGTVLSGSPPVLIPVDIAGLLIGSSSLSGAGTQAELTFSGPQGSINGTMGYLVVADTGTNSAVGSNTSFTVSTTEMLEPDVVYTVTLTASASAFSCIEFDDGDGCPAASASAAVDPTFTVDPGSPDALAYDIVTSSNLAAVAPEPSTLLMSTVGVSLIGLALAIRCFRNRMEN